MIDEKVLEKVILKKIELEICVKKHGYTDLRFFLSGSEDDLDSLSIICNFEGETNLFSTNSDIEKELSQILGIKVNFWGEGAYGLNNIHLKEAENSPLKDINKVIDYFIDVLIPCSTDKEPDENSRLRFKKLSEERAVFSKAKNANFSNMFFAGYNSSNPADLETFGENTFNKIVQTSGNAGYQEISNFLMGFMNSANQCGFDVKKIIDSVNNPAKKTY